MGMLPKPMSNEELAALRRKAQGLDAPAAGPATAEQIAYETGIKGLVAVVQRIEVLEKQVNELKEQLATAAKNGAALKKQLEEAGK